MEILLVVSGFNMDRGMEMTMVNADIDVQEGDMGEGSVPREVHRIATAELFQESSAGNQAHEARVRIYHQ